METVNANGAAIPAIGLGTWTLRGRECIDLVKDAIGIGYRHIDTAAMYENEAEVAEGLRQSGIARDDIFLTTKVWHPQFPLGDLRRAAEASLARLKVEKVDLLLIHWPHPDLPVEASMAALNSVRELGLTRHIGVSNFTTGLLAQAVAASEAPLACNQVEYHPYLDQSKVLAACRGAGVAMTSYCPLARGGDLFAEPAVLAAAKRHGKTPAQIVLRWHVQQTGVAAIPRSTKRERLAENLAIFDFTLSAEEMASISALGAKHMRICDFDFSPEWDAA